MLEMKNRLWVCFTLALLGAPAFAKEQYYRWTDENGSVHYSASVPDRQLVERVDVHTRDASVEVTDNVLVRPVPEAPEDDVAKRIASMEAQLCVRARDSLQVIEEGQSIATHSTTDKSIRPLVGVEREKAKLEAQAQVEHFCAPSVAAAREE